MISIKPCGQLNVPLESYALKALQALHCAWDYPIAVVKADKILAISIELYSPSLGTKLAMHRKMANTQLKIYAYSRCKSC